MDDRELLASTMSADGVQLERMGSFQPGHALCVYENIQKPFEIQIAEYDGNPEPPDNDELFNLLSGREVYRMVMSRDADIMGKKFKTKKERILSKCKKILDGSNVLDKNRSIIKDSSDTDSIIKFHAQEAQHFRNIDELSVEWLEFILEINEYARMNILKKSEELRILHSELKDLLDLMGRLMENYPELSEAILYRVKSRVAVGMSWINSK